MAARNYKVDDPIKVYYQAQGNQSGLTVDMIVFDEGEVEDVAQATTMTELGTTGRYSALFTPDAEGDWSVQISDSAGGEAVKQFSVGTYNIQEIGAKLQTVETKVDGIQSPPMLG
jgi:hypothetical protein